VKNVAQTSEGLKVALPAAFMAETAPADVVCAPWAGWIRDLAGEGFLMEVTDLVDKSEFSPDQLDWVTVNGALYGVPFKTGMWVGFWYIPSFFEEHGLTVPETWEEFKTLLADIKEIPGVEAPIASGAGWPIGNFLDDFLLARGGPDLYSSLLAGELAWTDPQVKVVFEELVELLEAGYFSVPADWAAQVDKFGEGKYALYVMGSWITGMVPDPEDIDFFPFPETKGLRGGVDFCTIPKFTEHPEAARELVGFLATAEAQTIWAERGGYTAPNLEVPVEIYPSPIERKSAEAMVGKRFLGVSDTAIGGEFPIVYPDQVTLLWTEPGRLDEVLEAIEASVP
ncbi:MAG: ABC transporter substrate-binding protein, partial [Anaerolineae bacterium]